MYRKAVIYIRTSSEAQGKKASPNEQEADCRSLAKEKGLVVVRVYRDIEKYRVKNKLVEPSGLRSDRPGLLAMLKDAAKGEFDVILAWREDQTLSWSCDPCCWCWKPPSNITSRSCWQKKHSTPKLHRYVPGRLKWNWRVCKNG